MFYLHISGPMEQEMQVIEEEKRPINHDAAQERFDSDEEKIQINLEPDEKKSDVSILNDTNGDAFETKGDYVVKNVDASERPSVPNVEVAREPTCIQKVFEPFLVIARGWRTYARQKVVFAGVALAFLYMTVLGFDSITVGQLLYYSFVFIL